jgi:fumarate hydratase class II
VAITMANASGSFELNVAKPVLISNLLQSIRVLADASTVFAERLVKDLQVDEDRVARNVENALLQATALNPVLGYDTVARITALALSAGITPRAAALQLGVIDGEGYDRVVDAGRMAGVRPLAD